MAWCVASVGLVVASWCDADLIVVGFVAFLFVVGGAVYVGVVQCVLEFCVVWFQEGGRGLLKGGARVGVVRCIMGSYAFVDVVGLELLEMLPCRVVSLLYVSSEEARLTMVSVGCVFWWPWFVTPVWCLCGAW